MLKIELREDGGLTLTSDDRNAENARVGDCFQTEEYDGEDDYYEVANVPLPVINAWADAPFVDDKLEVEFDPKYTEDILEALLVEFPEADEVLDQVLKAKVA